MFTYEVNVLCDNPDCDRSSSGCPTGEPNDSIQHAIESALLEANIAEKWTVRLAKDGTIITICPKCVAAGYQHNEEEKSHSE